MIIITRFVTFTKYIISRNLSFRNVWVGRLLSPPPPPPFLSKKKTFGKVKNNFWFSLFLFILSSVLICVQIKRNAYNFTIFHKIAKFNTKKRKIKKIEKSKNPDRWKNSRSKEDFFSNAKEDVATFSPSKACPFFAIVVKKNIQKKYSENF